MLGSLLFQVPCPATVPQSGEGASGIEGADEPILELGYRWRPLELTDHTFPAWDHLGLHGIEASWVAEDRLYLAHGRQYALLNGKEFNGISPARPMEVRCLPMNGISPYYSCLKYRLGAFFMKRGTRILRQDPVSGAWTTYFSGSRAFSQFEILPGGRIALVCPRTPPGTALPPGAAWFETVSSEDHDSMPLLEFHDPERPGKADRVIPFPSDLSRTLSRVNGYPLIDRTIQLMDHVLLVNGRAGQVFQLDTRTESVRLLDVPWKRLDSAFLKEVEGSGIRPQGPAGTLQISQFAFPFQIHVYPSSGREVVVAVVLATLDKGYSRKKDEQARAGGNRFYPLAKESTPGNRSGREWLRFFRYDPLSRTFTECRSAPFRRIRAEMQENWVSPDGDLIPLALLGFEPAAD
jgi:hypothetical protein